LAWILANGLHCSSSPLRDPAYVNIGNVDLIDKRSHRLVPISPGGTLADYVPFYFTPFSVMLLNIHSGRGVPRRGNDEIVILVSSISHAVASGATVLFTNAHAYLAWTSYYSDPARLNEIDWALLQKRDFKRDPDDLRKIERYQAEALIHRHLPVSGLLGVIVHDEKQKLAAEATVAGQGLSVPVYARPGWYFQ